MPKSESYQQAKCCFQQDCDFLDTNKDEICWGIIEINEMDYVDDDCFISHTCEGHEDINFGGKYKEELR